VAIVIIRRQRPTRLATIARVSEILAAADEYEAAQGAAELVTLNASTLRGRSEI
jgi:hypothetical protein